MVGFEKSRFPVSGRVAFHKKKRGCFLVFLNESAFNVSGGVGFYIVKNGGVYLKGKEPFR